MHASNARRSGPTAVLLALLAGGTATADPPRGVVVESVAVGSAAAAAGLEPGDVLRSWERTAARSVSLEQARGDLASPLDLMEVEAEQAPRGPVRLDGFRGGEALSVTLEPRRWGLAARPVLKDASERAYLAAKEDLEAGRLDQGLAAWRRLADELEAGEVEPAIWLRLRIGEAHQKARDWDGARGSFERGLRAADVAGAAVPAARAAEALSDLALAQGDERRALDLWVEALARRTALAPESLAVAGLLRHMGAVSYALGDRAAGREQAARSLALRERLAPDSLPVAESLNLGSWIRAAEGDTETAQGLLARAIAIADRLDPTGPEMLNALAYRGSVARARGELAEADAFEQRALALVRAEDAAGRARILNGLAATAIDRGDFVAGESYLVQALAGREPGSIGEGASWINLGSMHAYRGDYDGAADCYRRAADRFTAKGGRSVYQAAALSGLAAVARRQGDLDAAEQSLARAVSILEAIDPRPAVTCGVHRTLGEVAMERGDLGLAEERLRQAIEICEATSRGGLGTDWAWLELGEALRRRGRRSEAEVYFGKALALRERLVPGTLGEAEAAFALGRLYRELGRREEALRLLQRAVDALEEQTRNLGGSEEVRAGFRARYAPFFHELLDLLIELGRPEEAFGVLERSRARVLLALLAERDLRFERDLPEELDRRRRGADARYDRALAELAQVADEAGAKRAEILARLAAARADKREVRAAIRAAAPRLASLRYPEPLDLAGVRRALDPGTLLLAYALGAERSYAFAVGPGETDFQVVRLPESERALRARVEEVRSTIEARGHGAGRLLSRLSQTLLAPVAGPLARAERVLVLPDGPLHLVPFGALDDPRRPGRYLVEAKPVFLAASATVFADQKRGRGEGRAGRLAAFGDPVYSDPGDGPQRSDARRRHLLHGAPLEPLPASRGEVERLGDLYGEAAQVFVGPEATEERAKSLPQAVSFVHFACHALLDDAFPLESALALSLPGDAAAGGENGLLQAWEVFEQLRLDADLVVLSACETGLGKEVAGEGMLGLTRAFQYAGARSVLASLWSVSDETTAALMEELYRGLRAGRSKADALRDAQLRLLREPLPVRRGGASAQLDASHPFYWAAFQLLGDWR